MKAVRVHDYLGQALLDEIDEPTITGPLDVIVRLGGAGVCRTDLHILQGQWKDKAQVTLPYTLGHENAGWVEAIGSAVTNVSVGDGVILHPLVTCGLCLACRRGDDMHCENSSFPGIDADGGFAELIKTNARAVVALQPGLEPAAVAALADAGLTAYHAVKKALPLLPPGSSVVVTGVGGLGHIGVQTLTALSAAEIIVVERSPQAMSLAKDLGAHHVVSADGTEAEAVRELTKGKGVEVVLDFVGEEGSERSGPAMLRRAGSYFTIGYGGVVELPTIDIISQEINVVGNLVGTYTDLVELMELADRGAVALHTKTYALSQFAQALSDLDQGKVAGRAILVPG